ncbi:hypothetical protein [Phytomonospora endophytica]|uniref:Uncharacterized protein n=1 Tax=Phytomonospora endophytica TaxID=714109 RepID=A0A841FLE1_9ACTN|nr:hypothetical protein [Phytomonospora endophytica]MBB6036765.1 hypothetical protein [Phytomonospora endophytica]GIG68201.1 hypothetical protein Pen01_44960 [Phytomonospora endophytica]
MTLRGTFRAVTVDLAAAEAVWFDERVVRHASDGQRVTRTYTIPLPCARTAGGGPVEIPPSNGERRLPPPEPAALVSDPASGLMPPFPQDVRLAVTSR